MSTEETKFGSLALQSSYHRRIFAFNTGLVEHLNLVGVMCVKGRRCAKSSPAFELATEKTEILVITEIATRCEMILRFRIPAVIEEQRS